MIDVLVKSGRTMDAQKLILAELTKEFGGSARAAAKTTHGQWVQLKNAAGDMAEVIGNALLPTLKRMVEHIKPIVKSVSEWMDSHKALVERITLTVAGVAAFLSTAGPLLYFLPMCVQPGQIVRTDWVNIENAPMIHCLAMLQGLCGLREQEAAYLRECDIDHLARTITITETSAHKPKNRPSYRTIPVPPVVAEVLQAWIAGLKIRRMGKATCFFHQRRSVAGGEQNPKRLGLWLFTVSPSAICGLKHWREP